MTSTLVPALAHGRKTLAEELRLRLADETVHEAYDVYAGSL